MKGVLPIVAAVIGVQAAGALLFAWSGLYNIAASSPHWPITAWFLTFARDSSVRTYSMTVEEPPLLDDRALVARGLGHYAGACEPCHGAPGDRPTALSRGMQPVPPFLPPLIGDRSQRELFWIVKHGMKYTGMPAWPTQRRDDEVWAMVAFLEAMPGMPPAEYRERARGGTLFPAEDSEETALRVAAIGQAGDALVACARCHGLYGEGGGDGAFPRLAGQKADYLRQALRDYASGARPSGIMEAVAAELSEADVARLAEFYAARSDRPFPPAGEVASDLLAQGERIATQGVPERLVPACGSCHGVQRQAGGGKQGLVFPDLGGQFAAYLDQQLRLFAAGIPDGTAAGKIMIAAARGLTPEDIRAVAVYYAWVRPDGSGDGAPIGGAGPPAPESSAAAPQ